MEHQPFIGVYGNMVNDSIPQRFGKGDLEQIHFRKGCQAGADGIGLDLPPPLFLLQGIIPGLEPFIPLRQGIVPLNVAGLRQCLGGILVHQVPDHPGHHIQFLQKFRGFPVNGTAVQQFPLDQLAVLQECRPVGEQFTEGGYEMPFQIFLIKVGCVAFIGSLELGIALPDNTAVFTVGVPDFGAVVFAAVTADQLSGEGLLQLVRRVSFFRLASSSCTFSHSSGSIMASWLCST